MVHDKNKMWESECGLSDVEQVVARLHEWVLASEPGGWILWDGDLGAGKTTLIQALVAACGGSETLSPTFSLVHALPAEKGSIVHCDLYRIKSGKELLYLSLEEYVRDCWFFCIEWPFVVDFSDWENFFAITQAPYPPWILLVTIAYCDNPHSRRYVCQNFMSLSEVYL